MSTYFQRPVSMSPGAVRSRKWRAANPEAYRDMVVRQLNRRVPRVATQKRRAEFRSRGLCIHHGQPPAFGTKRCLFCWDQYLVKYGIDVGQYASMLASQKYLCQICRKHKPLRVDHCHASGAVRSLICNRCNVLVGYLETSEDEILNSVRQYLKGRKLGDVA